VPPVDEAGSAAPADGARSVEGGAAAGRVEGAASIEAGADLVGEVARRLKGGEITAREAVELLIDDAVERQVGRVTIDRDQLADELRELLRRYTETDPYLAAKVRRLGSRT
jgi:hypothetical protein